jgi:hypothetical protein
MGSRKIRSATLAIVLGAGALTVTTGISEVARAEPGTLEVPAPVVQGPIPSSGATSGTPRDYPFMATPIDLAARGYVEEEYFISLAPTAGVPGSGACTYNTPAGDTGSVANCDGSYKTRIMVRRPVSAEAFNGTVLLEWQNVTAQYDVDHYWLESSEHIMREGYAWVGVSAQRAGVHPSPTIPCLPAFGVLFGCNNLRTWSPQRYGASGGNLNVPMGDGLSFDIFSHAAQALRTPRPDGPAPMGDLETDTVIALGTSQSGGRLATYFNSVQPLQASPVIDAFFIGETRAAVRADREVPVLRLLSEVDVAATFSPPDTLWYRHWEVAGASHADAGFTSKIQEFIVAGVILQTQPVCDRQAPSRIPKRYTYHAAWDHMVRWVNDGIAPPIAPRIRFDDAGVIDRRPSLTPTIAISGNALGGIQLSEHSVPTAYNGTGNAGPPFSFCNLFGVHEPYTAEMLRSLYRNQGAYVSAVASANNDNRRAGYIVGADSEESTRSAAESGVGRR